MVSEHESDSDPDYDVKQSQKQIRWTNILRKMKMKN